MEPEGSSTARTGPRPSSPGEAGGPSLASGLTTPSSVAMPSSAPIEAGWDRSPTVIRPWISNESTEPSFELAQRLVGTQLGEYLLEEPVGGGGMGIVFRARDLRLERIVALKLLTNRWERDGELKRRFQNEAQSAARLNHENIATIFDVGESNGWSYIVFEFLEGINIRDLVLRDGPLPIDIAIHITRQITHALAHAATRDVVHRDIKPSNILLTPDNRAKLVDMGLARLHDVRPESGDLTASGVTLGTFDYISPEQAEDPRQADLRSDIYSLGCTLYFMLTGRPPFPDGTVLQKLLSHTKEEAPDPRLVRPDIPVGLLHVLKQMMAKSPSDRYQHPEVLIADLAAIQQGRLPYPKSAVFRPVRTTRLRKFVPWLAPTLFLLAGLLATEIFFSVSTNEPQGIPDFQWPRSSESTETLSQDSPSAVVPTPPTSVLPRNTSAISAVNDLPQGATNFLPNPEVAPAVAANISSIIVASQHRLVPDAYVAVTIDEAFEYCKKTPNISQIVLEVDGPISVGTPTRFTQENLTITAAKGFQPTIVFPSGESTQNSPSIQIASGRITWKHLHLVWDVPKSLREPRSVFALEEGVHCTFQHCTLTLRNDDELGPYHKNHAWLTVKSPSPTVTFGPTADTVQPTSIEVEDSYVRGEGSLLEVQSGARLSLAVRQTAILLTETLFRFQEPLRGIAHRDENRVTLQNVMAVCRSGLGIINTGYDGSAIPSIHLEIAQSVVALPTDLPLFLHQGNGEMQDYLRSLHYQGNRNVYRGPGNFWEVNARGDDHHDTFSWSQWKSHWQAINHEAEFNSQYLPLASAFTTTQPLSAVPIDALRNFPPSGEALTSGSTLKVGAQLNKIHVANYGPLLDTKPRIP